MDCKLCAENLTAYLDGELTQADSAQVHSHLGKCESCSDEVKGLREASGFIQSQKREVDLRARSWNLVRAQISAANSPALSAFSAFVPGRASWATLACIAILAFGYWRYQHVQQDKLDAYIAQYVKAREASRSFSLTLTGTGAGLKSENFTGNNPFIEATVGLDLNPFRSEDR